MDCILTSDVHLRCFVYVILIALICSCPYPIFAQQSHDSALTPPTTVHLDGTYIKSYFTDSWDIIKSPVSWKGKQWLTASVLTGSCVLVYLADDEIQSFFQGNRSKITDDFSKYFFDPYGLGLYTLPLLGGAYFYGLIAKNPNAESVALKGVKVYIISGIFSQVIKQIAHRHRPDQNNPRQWDGPLSNFTYDAFPSGHTLSAFAMAAFFKTEFKEHPWIGILSYVLATGVGLSRINDNKHWASDVFAGAVLGHYIGKFIAENYACKRHLEIQPVYSSQIKGLRLVYLFN